jgi:hypothetical protein
MSKFIYDHMVNAEPRIVSRAVMHVADGVQTLSPDVQVMGAAAFFLMLCEAYKVPAQDVFTATTNLMNSEKGDAIPQFNAAREYIKHEVVNA